MLRATLLSLHNPVARTARALAGRYTVRAARRAKGYTGLATVIALRALSVSASQHLLLEQLTGDARECIERAG